MQRWLVRSDGPIAGKTVAELMQAWQVNVVQHERAGQPVRLCPGPDTRFAPGDGLIIQGPIETLDQLRAAAIGQAVGAER